MKVICSYCRKNMLDEKEPLDVDQVPHGMCPDCADHFSRQRDGLSLAEYLDNFDYPVLITNGERRIMAANKPMARMLGKEERDITGLLGGEAFECVYARLEEGCGQSVHCQTCTVRNTVISTYETGESVFERRCFVERDEGREYFLVTTVKLRNSVQVTIEPEVVHPDPG